MCGEKSLKKLITSMTPVLWGQEYVFATLAKVNFETLRLMDPLATFQENEGMTVVVLKNKAEQYDLEYSGSFRCITLNVHSSLEAVGLTAAVSTKLTKANISANVIAAYYHDHIFVSANDAEAALSNLQELAKTGV